MALFTYMTENPDLCQALYGKSWESEFTRNAKKLIAERCLGEFAPDGGTEEQKYMLAFAVNGCFGTIVAWQEAGFQPPAAEIARITGGSQVTDALLASAADILDQAAAYRAQLRER